MSDEIQPGSGFLMYVYTDDEFGVEGGWDKVVNLNGVEHPDGIFAQMNSHPDGWSLLGNPYASSIDFGLISKENITNVAYVFDPNSGGTTESNTGDNISVGSFITTDGAIGDLQNGHIAPFQGFFVQNTSAGNSSVTFNKSNKISTDADFFGKHSEEEVFAIRLELDGENLNNSLWLRFSEDGSMENTIGDALQLLPFSNEFSILSTRKSEELLDIGHYPIDFNSLTIPIYAKTARKGAYSIKITDLFLPFEMEFELYDMSNGNSYPIEEGLQVYFELEENNFGRDGSTTAKSNIDVRDILQDFKPTVAKSFDLPVFLIRERSEIVESLPQTYKLNQNYPNPFNPTTTISYELPENSNVTLQVYDMTGRQVATLVNGTVQAGSHRISFDASGLSSGIYLYRLTAGSSVISRKLTVLK